MRDRSSYEIIFNGETLKLLGEKAIYWEKYHVLIVSDLHLGKAGHFRKHGIPVPTSIHYSDLDRLSLILKSNDIKKVIFLGDLFHSDINNEWNQFSDWLELYDRLEFILVRGNHDILPDRSYLNANIQVVDIYDMEPFSFSHEKVESRFYNLSGHIHPCVRMRGLGKQGMRVSCFYFGETHGYLPAYGNFTGNHTIRPKSKDKVYGVIKSSVVDLNSQLAEI